MKNVFHDIIPNDKRSIRNIRIEKRGAQQIDGIHKVEIKQDFVSEPEMETRRKLTLSENTNTAHSESDKGTESINATINDLPREYPMSQDTSSKHTNIEPAFYEGRSSDFIRPIHKPSANRGSNITSDDELHQLEDDDEFNEWRKKKNPYIRGIGAIVVLLLLLVFGLGTYFKKATITIKPVKHEIVLHEQTLTLSSVDHEIQNTDFSKETELVANGTIKVERKSTGKVILYNAFSSSPQRLVATTRLQTPNGLIYRLKETVSIPGQTTANGKKVPGSIEATVEADQIGESYNQGFRDFTVVAYKGTDRFEKIYGRSKSALTGGYNGEVPNIPQKDINTAVLTLKEQIEKDANEYFSKIVKDKEGYIYILDAKKIAFGEPKTEVSKDGKKATVSVTAKVSAPLFVSNSLFRSIIEKQQIDTIESSEIVYTGETKSLKISIPGDTTIDSKSDSIIVSGSTTVSSAIDTKKIARAVSGLEIEPATLAIKNLVELDAIEVEVSPWWVKKLPSADRIHILLEQ